MNAYLDTAIEAGMRAGDVLLSYWGKVKKIESKSSFADLVTEADTASEAAILDYLKETCPDHSILSEEAGSGGNPSSPYVWIIDPLDGTTNYSHGFPVFSVSIALQHQDSLIAGVVYDPYRKELFSAAAGNGAFLNGEPIHVSKEEALEKSLLATGFAYDKLHTEDNNYKEFCRLTDITHGVRRLGSAALDLAYVAAGRLDGYWERGLQKWDLAAGALLVLEAGGKATAYDTSPLDLASGRILATNGRIHTSLSKEILFDT